MDQAGIDVQRVIEGSRRLNTMKAEIDLVVGVVMGLRTHNVSNTLEFDYDGLHWRIQSKWDTVVVVTEPGKKENPCYQLRVGAEAIPLNLIMRVHSGLPTFLAQMRQGCPEIEAPLAFIYDAADALIFGDRKVG